MDSKYGFFGPVSADNVVVVKGDAVIFNDFTAPHTVQRRMGYPLHVLRVRFGPRMTRSYKVDIHPSLPYLNDREPHIETPIPNLTGKSGLIQLHTRRQVCLPDGRVAVLYNVALITEVCNGAGSESIGDPVTLIDVASEDTPIEMHLTVYVGDRSNAGWY